MILDNGTIIEGQFYNQNTAQWKRRIYNETDSYTGWWYPSKGCFGYGIKINRFGTTSGVWSSSSEVKEDETSFFGFFKKKDQDIGKPINQR